MPPFDLVVFDLDGTLIDSRPDIGAALNRALSGHGLQPYLEAQLDPMIGKGARFLVERAVLGRLGRADEGITRMVLTSYQMEYWRDPVSRTRSYPGVVEGLQRLAGEGGPRRAVATNKPGHLARLCVERLGLAHLFDEVYGEGDVPRPKPDPAMLRAAMKSAGTTAERTLYVGDGPTDLLTARAAGVTLCFVEWGYPGEAPIEWSGPRATRFTDVVRLALEGPG